MTADSLTAPAEGWALLMGAATLLPGILPALLCAALVSAAGICAALRLSGVHPDRTLRRRERAGGVLFMLGVGGLMFGALTGSSAAGLSGVAVGTLGGVLLRDLYPDDDDEDETQLW